LPTIAGGMVFEGNIHDKLTLCEVLKGINRIPVDSNGFTIGEKAVVYEDTRLNELFRELDLQYFIMLVFSMV
jgi:hypothetical protein